jgi:hypothetical protein
MVRELEDRRKRTSRRYRFGGLRFDNVDGILGYDFLAATIVEVDIVKKRLTVHDPAAFAPAGLGVSFLVDLATGIPRVPIRINGTLKGNGYLDTGNAGEIIMSGGLYKRAGVAVTGHARISGVDGDSAGVASCGYVGSIDVGPLLRYKHVAVCFGGESASGSDGGLVGFEFLRHFNWTFDYGRSALTLTPNGT